MKNHVKSIICAKQVILFILFAVTIRLTPVFGEEHKSNIFTCSREITSLASCRGKLWGASPGGLLEYDMESGNLIKHLPGPDNGLKLPVTFAGRFRDGIAAAGRDWVVIHEGGKWKSLPVPTKNPVNAWACRETLLCASEGSIFQWTGEGWKLLGEYPAKPNTPVLLDEEKGTVLVVCGENIKLIPGFENTGVTRPSSFSGEKITSACLRQGKPWLGTVHGIWQWKDGRWLKHNPPAGSFVSALLSREESLIIGLYGDGAYSFDGESWQRITPQSLDSRQKEILCLAPCPGGICCGTAQFGIALFTDREIKSVFIPKEPTGNNIFALARYKECLYAPTFENGIFRECGDGWEKVPGCPSPWMRHLAVFDGFLWSRDADGNPYKYDGEKWEKIILKPAWCSLVANCNDKLIIGGYGGFFILDKGCEWMDAIIPPEKHPMPVYNINALKGRVITGAAFAGDELWLGTAKAGCYQLKKENGQWECRHHPLIDPWVTSLASIGGKEPFAGTFNGGIFRWTGDEFLNIPGDTGQKNVICMVSDGSDLLFGTRRGLFRLKTGENSPILFEGSRPGEIQAILPVKEGLWVGTSLGLYYYPRKLTQQAVTIRPLP